MRRKWLCLIVVACACLFLATTVRVDASTYGKLQQAPREKDQAEKKAEQVQGDLGDLNEERAGLQTYLDQLNDELLQTSSELAGIEDLCALAHEPDSAEHYDVCIRFRRFLR